MVTHAFLYSGGVMTDLGTLGGTRSFSLGINDAGQIVGYSTLAGDLVTHAYLYSGGVMTDLGTLGGSYSAARDINASGQVVGSSFLAGDSGPHGFLYSGGVMTDLNSLLPAGSGWTIHNANAINDSGQITGFGLLNGQARGFLMTPFVVPEPSTVVLISIGGLVLAAVGYRRRLLSDTKLYKVE